MSRTVRRTSRTLSRSLEAIIGRREITSAATLMTIPANMALFFARTVISPLSDDHSGNEHHRKSSKQAQHDGWVHKPFRKWALTPHLSEDLQHNLNNGAHAEP